MINEKALVEWLKGKKYITVDEESCLMTEDFEKENQWELSRNCFINKVIKFIEEQPKVGEWIPCSERLPDTFEDTKSSDVVLVCGYDKEKDYHWKAMAFYVNTEALKRWFFAECKNTDKPIDWIDIVAWMPLPEDYKGE